MNQQATQHIYISPLESCNLNCKMCYTQKPPGRLSNQQIIEFVNRYAKTTPLQSITFCGGEVFLLADFPDLINQLTTNYYVQIITNGTIDRLAQIDQPNMVNLIVSVDSLPEYHDLNRGVGAWQKTIEFMKKGLQLGFHLEVFSIVTRENLTQIPAFESRLFEVLHTNVPITYHPRKPMTYIKNHPVANRVGELTGFTCLSAEEQMDLETSRKVFPPKQFGCYQIAVMANGEVLGCCEGIRPLGTINDEPKKLIDQLEARLVECSDCVEPEFRCGLKRKE